MSKGLDWKSLVQQQPHPSSVVKQKRFRAGRSPASTPSNSLVEEINGTVIAHTDQWPLPILFLRHVMSNAEAQPRPSSQEPADYVLSRLAEFRNKTASLINLGGPNLTSSCPQGATQQQSLADRQLLQNPVPPPEHVQHGGCCWYAQEQSSTSNYYSLSKAHDTANSSGAISSAFTPYSSSEGGSLHAAGQQQHTVQQQNGAAGDSMRTSATGQSADSSLLTTANSPSMQWQNALMRLRHLQQQAEETFMQGHEVSKWAVGSSQA